MGCVLSTVESKGDRFKEVMQPFAAGVASQAEELQLTHHPNTHPPTLTLTPALAPALSLA